MFSIHPWKVGNVRLHLSVKDAIEAAKRSYRSKGYAAVYRHAPVGDQALCVGHINRDSNGKLVLDLTWEGSHYA